jgi:predicted GIY-YIG superfamily endonuclease
MERSQPGLKTKKTDPFLSKKSEMHNYVCYILSNMRGRTYVGITNNISRRLRQHNGEIKGGARATAGKGPWALVAYVDFFVSKSQALSFEWFMHHLRPRYRYIGSVSKRVDCTNQIFARFPKKFANVRLICELTK